MIDNTSSLLQEGDKDEQIKALKEALAEKSEEIKRLRGEKPAEWILCAAIWYPDDRAEHIVFWPKNISKGLVVCGYRHNFIINQYYDMTLNRTDKVKHVQGFLTSKNRFVDRVEGNSIAIAAGQCIGNTEGDELISEDLY